jgi:hypothetical protein
VGAEWSSETITVSPFARVFCYKGMEKVVAARAGIKSKTRSAAGRRGIKVGRKKRVKGVLNISG